MIDENRQKLQIMMVRQINHLFVLKLKYASLVLKDIFDKSKSEFQTKYMHKKAESIKATIEDTRNSFPWELGEMEEEMCQHEDMGQEIFGEVFGQPLDYFDEFKDEVEEYFKALGVLKAFDVERYAYLQGCQIDLANLRNSIIQRLGLEKAAQFCGMKLKDQDPQPTQNRKRF